MEFTVIILICIVFLLNIWVNFLVAKQLKLLKEKLDIYINLTTETNKQISQSDIKPKETLADYYSRTTI